MTPGKYRAEVINTNAIHAQARTNENNVIDEARIGKGPNDLA